MLLLLCEALVYTSSPAVIPPPALVGDGSPLSTLVSAALRWLQAPLHCSSAHAVLGFVALLATLMCARLVQTLAVWCVLFCAGRGGGNKGVASAASRSSTSQSVDSASASRAPVGTAVVVAGTGHLLLAVVCAAGQAHAMLPVAGRIFEVALLAHALWAAGGDTGRRPGLGSWVLAAACSGLALGAARLALPGICRALGSAFLLDGDSRRLDQSAGG